MITPYANVDMTALVHQGLNADLASAYSLGDAVARNVLGQVFRPDDRLAARRNCRPQRAHQPRRHRRRQHGRAEQRRDAARDTAVFEPDDAVTSIRTGAGQPMNVLLADNALTGVLSAGDSSSGALSQSTQFAVEQRFLAETAMIAAEAPYSSRSVVVAPPQDWSPSQALASVLLNETRERAVAEAGHAGQPDHGAGRRSGRYRASSRRAAKRARANSAAAT